MADTDNLAKDGGANSTKTRDTQAEDQVSLATAQERYSVKHRIKKKHSQNLEMFL